MRNYDHKSKNLLVNFFSSYEFRKKLYNRFSENIVKEIIHTRISYEQYLLFVILFSFSVSGISFTIFQMYIYESLLLFLLVVIILYFLPLLSYLRELNIIHYELVKITGNVMSFSSFISIYEMVRILAENDIYLLSKNFKALLRRLDEGSDFSSAVKNSFTDWYSDRIEMFSEFLIISYQTGKVSEVFSSSYQIFYQYYINDVKKYASLYTFIILVFVSFGVLFPLFFNAVSFFFSDSHDSSNVILSFLLLLLLVISELMNPSIQDLIYWKRFVIQFIKSFVILILFYLMIFFELDYYLLIVSFVFLIYSAYSIYSSYSKFRVEDMANTYLHISTLDNVMSFDDMIRELSKKQYGNISFIFSELYRDMKSIGTENSLIRLINRYSSFNSDFSSKNLISSSLIKELVSNLLLLYHIGNKFRDAIIASHQHLLKMMELERERESLVRVPRYALIISILMFPLFLGLLSALKTQSLKVTDTDSKSAIIDKYLLMYTYFIVYSISLILGLNYGKDVFLIVVLGLSTFYPIYIVSSAYLFS
ncbi:MAG: type II secretion system F family protein [Candidatus Micrarchaeota archaeon]|nr:type II secretion system F family protein [Candidatus Micrarchaeota archaeon]